jgi:hypothetical protein
MKLESTAEVYPARPAADVSFARSAAKICRAARMPECIA